MINGLGVVGWGVGGIEAEAGMLGQPVYFLTPEVVGVHLTGTLKEGVTATDLVLRVTEMLRKQKVVGKFVEFFGEGAAALSVTDRATIGNMAPEYGATMGFFGVDEETVAYLRGTGRSEALCAAFENYYKAQRLWGIPRKGEVDYTVELELDLGSIVPGVAGPKRPQDRINLPELKQTFEALFEKPLSDGGYGKKFADSAMASALKPEVYRKLYSDFAEQNPKWNEIPSSTGEVYQLDPEEHLHPRAAILRWIWDGARSYQRNQGGSRAWHLRRFRHDRSHQPGRRHQTSPAGKFLLEHGVPVEDFNSYGSRRGNDRIMTRGTFANVRIKNLMVPGVEGGYTLRPTRGGCS